ncbi:MAG: signal peptide peptidase SppA [Chloroflexia bacterium]
MDNTVSSSAPPRSRRGCWITAGAAALVGGLILLACVVGVVAVAASGAGAASSSSWDEEYVSGDGEDKIAIIPVEGVIGADSGGVFSDPGATAQNLESQLRQAADDPLVRAVVLEVNTPGGGVVESDEMYQAILDFKAASKQPVVVSMGDVAASGGYYISMAADRVVANPATLTGSLGVIFSILNYDEAAEKLGITEVVIKSGTYKDIGSPTRDMTAQEQQILQTLINETYEQFVDVIEKGRKLPEARVKALADGRVYSGRQAKGLGLVDDLGGLDAATGIAENLANVQNATVVRYSSDNSLLSMLTSQVEPEKPTMVQLLEAAGFDPTPGLQYMYRP